MLVAAVETLVGNCVHPQAQLPEASKFPLQEVRDEKMLLYNKQPHTNPSKTHPYTSTEIVGSLPRKVLKEKQIIVGPF